MKLTAIHPNPQNPRRISADQLAKLKESIQRDPEFMRLRPIVVDGDGMILGGTQRWKACKALGMADLPDGWVVRAGSLTEEQRRRFILVDNAPQGMAGEWDIEALQVGWTVPELEAVGLEVAASPIERPTGDAAGASPWDRVGDAQDGIMFSFGSVQTRLPTELYEAFSQSVGRDNLEAWLRESIRH